jgi:hypothetical protein
MGVQDFLITVGAPCFHNRCYTPCRLAKRSQALRGRNLTRDSPTDGASMQHQASGNESGQRLLLSNIEHPSYASKNPGVWGRAPAAVVPTAGPTTTAAPFHNACLTHHFITEPATSRVRTTGQKQDSHRTVVEQKPNRFRTSCEKCDLPSLVRCRDFNDRPHTPLFESSSVSAQKTGQRPRFPVFPKNRSPVFTKESLHQPVQDVDLLPSTPFRL